MRHFRSTWSRFEFRKPRHPLTRVAFGLIGAVVLAVLVFFGLFVGLAMLAAGLIWRIARQLRAPASPQAPADVIDGEYTVVHRPHGTLVHR